MNTKKLLSSYLITLFTFLIVLTSKLFSFSDPFLEHLPSSYSLKQTALEDTSSLFSPLLEDISFSVSDLGELQNSLEKRRRSYQHILQSLPTTLSQKKTLCMMSWLHQELQKILRLEKAYQKIRRDFVLTSMEPLHEKHLDTFSDVNHLLSSTKIFLIKALKHFHALANTFPLISKNSASHPFVYLSKNATKVLLLFLDGEKEKKGKLIGKGGFGNISLVQIGKYTFAKKVPIPSLKEKKQNFQVESLQKEISVLASCKSKGLVSPLLFEWQPPKILMPLSKTGSLHDLIKQKSIPIEDILPLIKEIALGLQSLHQKRIIHHDIKPANILLFKNHARICDFGLMGYFGLTSSSGTCYYYSPEKAKKAPLTGASDLWSLGVVLYKMLYKKNILEDLYHEEIKHLEKQNKKRQVTKSKRKIKLRNFILEKLRVLDQATINEFLSIKETTFLQNAAPFLSDPISMDKNREEIRKKLCLLLQNFLQINPQDRMKLHQILEVAVSQGDSPFTLSPNLFQK